MPDREPTISLTQDQIDFYYSEGYLSIPALTSLEEVAQLRDIYDRLFEQRAGREEGNEFDLAGTDEEGKKAALPQILNPAKYAPELNDTQLLINARHVIQQLCNSKEATCGFAHAIFKPKKIGAETPWHQDAAYWGGDWYARTISIWVPLQEATLDNGCMQFIPRSQRSSDVLPHRSINNDPRVHGLELLPEELHRATTPSACPLPPGGATFHGGYTLHYTRPNISDIDRRALILMGGLPGIKRDVPIRLPWMEEKKTARNDRAKVAAEKARTATATAPGVL